MIRAMPCNFFSAVALLMMATAGCGSSGPQVAPVHGRVTLDGQPLANADITFQPEGAQRASIGRTNNEGRYELAYKLGQTGAIVGKHTVNVEVSEELVRNPPPIPERYASKSELHPEVKPGDNEINFELKSDPK
jgi:hypothetical protein